MLADEITSDLRATRQLATLNANNNAGFGILADVDLSDTTEASHETLLSILNTDNSVGIN